MNLLEHAEREFKAAGWLDKKKDPQQDMMMDCMRELLAVFANQGHSGFSANYAMNLFNQLGRYEPIVPLTGEDWEWTETSPGCFQNKRCSHVFKEDGKAYDINGRIFQEPNGVCFTSSESHVPVTFPYTPKKEIVKVDASNQS